MYNYPFQFLVVALAGWINRHQQDVIEFVRSIKSECVERMIFSSEAALLRALTSYAEHYTTSGTTRAWLTGYLRQAWKWVECTGRSSVANGWAARYATIIGEPRDDRLSFGHHTGLGMRSNEFSGEFRKHDCAGNNPPDSPTGFAGMKRSCSRIQVFI